MPKTPKTPKTPTKTKTRTSAGAPLPAPTHPLRGLLDVDDTFAVTSFDEELPDRELEDYAVASSVVDALENVTSAGSMFLVAGCMLWVARRLEKVTDVSRCYFAAEALLCYLDGRAYFRPDDDDEWPRYGEAKDGAQRAVRDVGGLLLYVFDTDNDGKPLPPEITPAAGRAVTIARLALGRGGKPPFEAWLTMVLHRLAEAARNPRVAVRAKLKDKRFDWSVEVKFERENMGPPLPPALLDPRHDDASDLGALYAAFLGAVDWEKNPFLASPELMKQRGFPGTPYVPTPGAEYPKRVRLATMAKPGGRTNKSTTNDAPNPYRFLETLDAMPKAKRTNALRAYVASRALPRRFDRNELLLEHAFRQMLGRPVVEVKGLHVGILEASIDVVGDLSVLFEDERPRIPALRGFEPVIEVSDVDAVKELLVSSVGERRLEGRMSKRSSDLAAVRMGDTRIGSVTREELAEIADDLHDHVREVRMIAPSDGTLFDALRYMLQQEDEPWGMSDILSPSDMIVGRVDAKLEAALASVEDEDLAKDLSAFCDAQGRAARAWRWNGKDRKRPGEPPLRFVAGYYDGEGVGCDFGVYRVDQGSSRG